MPDLTGIPALDVALGLSFIFLLLSLVASAGQELLAGLFALRARTLEEGLRKMLADPAPSPASTSASASSTLLDVKDSHGNRVQPGAARRDLLFLVYTHPLIRSLYRENRNPLSFGRRTLAPTEGTAEEEEAARRTSALATNARLPSYIAPRFFALALMDTVAPAVLLTDDEGRPRAAHDVLCETRRAIAALNIPDGVRYRLLALLDDARGDIDAFRRNIEAWFDDTMARVSGWYKRRSQLFIILMAVGVTGAMNVNTLTVGERLWRDPTLRSAVAQQAGRATGATAGKTADERLRNAVRNVEEVTQLGAPIGWAQGDKSDPRHVDLGSLGGIARLLGGWLLTILAVSLGAPFWFDTLSRLSRLRGSGKPESPLPASGRGLPGERVVTGTPPVTVTVQHVPALAAAAAASGGGEHGPGDPAGPPPQA